MPDDTDLSGRPIDDADGAALTPLTDAYRLVRRVSPPQAPYAGWLARRADGEVIELVDVGRLSGWPGLGCAPGGHVLAAVDIVRGRAGHAVELPWCVERLDRLLARRESARAGLAAGEGVTLAVSIIRGVGEVMMGRRPDDTMSGQWWVTEDGKPLFVAALSEADPPVFAGAAALLEQAARVVEHACAAVLADASRSLSRREIPDEAPLFAVAEPRALRRDVAGPEQDVPQLPARIARGASTAVRAEPATAASSVARYVDADIAQVAAGLWDGARQRLRRRAASRAGTSRRPWLVAVPLTAAILAVGLLWPGSDVDPGAAGAAPVPVSASGSSGADPAGEEPVGSDPVRVDPARVEADGWESAVDALLQARARCVDDSCRSSFADDPLREIPGGAIDLPAAARTVSLLDDFGDVAVLRVDPTESGDGQIVVVIRAADAVRLRDVYAAQPH